MRYVHQDHLGSTSVITDDTGAAVYEASYDPWGNVSASTGTADTDRLYTGQRFDAATGFYYYNARYYDPTLARFISPDTIVPGVGDPQAWNRYAYVRGNPMRYVDPDGSWHRDAEFETLRDKFNKSFIGSEERRLALRAFLDFQSEAQFEHDRYDRCEPRCEFTTVHKREALSSLQPGTTILISEHRAAITLDTIPRRRGPFGIFSTKQISITVETNGAHGNEVGPVVLQQAFTPFLFGKKAWVPTSSLIQSLASLDSMTVGLLIHEVVHVKQRRDFGDLDFDWLYLTDSGFKSGVEAEGSAAGSRDVRWALVPTG